MVNLKKIIFLILIIFFLQSCSGIKIVIEKDCDCEDKKIEKNISNNNSENNLESKISEITENIEKPELLRYLTWKFTVNQDEENTYVYYKDKMFFKIENNISAFNTEELEEKPIIKEDENILKRELAKKIIVKNVKLNFYSIELENIEKNSKVLVDIKEGKSWNIDFIKSPFEKITFWRSWKYLMYEGWEDCNWGLIYINNESLKLKKVFENDCDYIWDYPESYKEIKSFSLWDWEIKVTYVDSFWNKEIEEISLESIK